MNFNDSGGGFMYGPFTFSIAWRANLDSSGIIGTAGMWHEIAVSTPARSRWMQLTVMRPTHLGSWEIQLGLGTLGSQIVWMPDAAYSTYPGYYFETESGAQFDIDKKNSMTWNFPINLPKGSHVWVRVADLNVALVCNVLACVYVWG
jgi:hypothetical protein